MKAVLGQPGGVVVWCPGRARTKGSLKPIHVKMGPGRCQVSLTESGGYSEAWKLAMIDAIREVAECERYAGAVMVDRTFHFERLCKPDEAMPWPTREGGTWGHGDVDKLTRNLFDAITQSGLIKDDSLIVGGRELKRWAGAEGPGVGFAVSVAPEDPSWLVTGWQG